MPRKSVLTARQNRLRACEHEREIGRLQYAARLAVLDNRVAVARRFYRQADELAAMARVREPRPPP